MSSAFFTKVRTLELEEKILNGAALGAAVSVFLPWIGGRMLGSDGITHSGFGFYTSFMGIAVFLIHLTILLITIIPLTGGPTLVRKQRKEQVRLILGCISFILVLSALSVLAKVTFEFSGMEVRFGILVCLFCSSFVSLYAFLQVQEQRKATVHELFHQTEDGSARQVVRPPNTVPPPPSVPEEHRPHLL